MTEALGSRESAEVGGAAQIASRPGVRRGWLVRRLLLAGDLVGLTVAFVTAQAIAAGRGGTGGTVGSRHEALIFVASLPCWVLAAKLAGLYTRDCERTDHSTFDEAVAVFHLVTAVAWSFVIAAWVTALAHPDFRKLLVFWVLAIVGIVVARVVARSAARRMRAYRQRTLIVGTGQVGELLGRKIRNHPEYGLDLVGFVDHADAPVPVGASGLLLGPPAALPELVESLDVERVIVAFPQSGDDEVVELVRALKDFDVQVDIVPRLFEIVFPAGTLHTLEGLPLLGLPPFGLARSSALLKRGVDIAVASLTLVILAPFFALIALAVKLDSRGPVLFKQTRVGRRGRPFTIYKFRSMTADAEEQKATTAHLNMHGADPRMFKVQGDPRVTRVGGFLRRYSLDELPQLVNVVRGEMSLVGPRPLIHDEAVHVEDWARRRLDLRPGVTGLWQVLGRSDIPFGEMTHLDYRYVMSWSLWTDFRLLFQTVPAVLRRRGAY